ncbi:FAD-dependent oxidoreductase [Agrococcus sp. KRD186]|jgi:2-polyprenyl-6-methoxyphenol hydroxylase-like FAD-dependent oxidoreductase|uniref:FAD-dependent oxidoreductase n=1 Tax=Agrococcus sp. KRD186 TaxID=2729730 RepID=UPI0019D1C316|nr:NAD(P)/FAD-dependent oxidoreductase [Agrococcus sp. KRD186]
MTGRHEVAVVGGGAVGLLLACLLAQRGVDVVVLERRGQPSTSARAIGIHPPGLAALDVAGVGASIRREGAPIRRGIALSGGREVAGLRLSAEPIRSLPQLRTETLLRERLAALSPGALRSGAEVVALSPGSASVEMALADGRRLVVDWLVGADGVRSTVRELLGIDWLPRRGLGAYAMVDAMEDAAARTDPAAADAALLHLEPDGIVESFPMPGGMRRWVARLAAPADDMPIEAFQSILDARLREPPLLPAAARVSTFVAQQRIVARCAHGRVVLVGDAAHEVSPIGGQGMSLGWLDALALDRMLAGGPVDASEIERYARARRRSAELAIRRAAWNMAMGAPASGVALGARLAFARALALPPARTALSRAFTMRGL